MEKIETMVLPFPSFFFFSYKYTPHAHNGTPYAIFCWPRDLAKVALYHTEGAKGFWWIAFLILFKNSKLWKRNGRRKIQGKYFKFSFVWGRKKKEFVFFWNLTQHMDEFYRIKFCHRLYSINLISFKRMLDCVFYIFFILIKILSSYF